MSNIRLARKQVVRVANLSEPREIDPGLSVGDSETRIEHNNLFVGLLSLAPVSFKPVPEMAKSWEISPDQKVYTFKIRENAKWSDGKVLTSEDFLYSWLRVLDPSTASQYSYAMYYIKNAEVYNKGDLEDASKVGLEAPDPETLIVTLENPTPFFLKLLDFPTYYPVPRHTVEKYKAPSGWTEEGVIVSNGPFKLAEWRANKHIKMVRNEYYWNASAVKLEEAFFYPVADLDTADRLFWAGEIDETMAVPDVRMPRYKQEIIKDPDKYHPLKIGPLLSTIFLKANSGTPPMNDKRVRRALSLVIDREQIVSEVMMGGEKAATSLIPPGLDGYLSRSRINSVPTEEDIREAKKILAEAGFPEGRGFPKISVLYVTNSNSVRVMRAVTQMWKKSLGIDAAFHNEDWTVYMNLARNLDFVIRMDKWIADYVDPNSYLELFLANSGNSNCGWSNKEYDHLIRKEAPSFADKAKHFECYQRAEAILLDELPIIPIYFETQKKLISEKLRLFLDGAIMPWQTDALNWVHLKHYVLLE